MEELTNKLPGSQEPVHAKESRGTAARLTDGARGPKNGSPKGRASPKPRGDKVANKLVANDGKSPTRSPTRAIADLPTNLQGNQDPFRAGETRTSKAYRTDYARGAMNGEKQGHASPKPRNIFAIKVTTNKKMDDRVKKGKQSNAEGSDARFEQKRALGKPLPQRGGVAKAIMRKGRKVVVEMVAGVNKFMDTCKAFCCVREPFDVDAFVVDLPFPTRSEPTATLWAKVEL